jgi:CBS-domain-containing membrane protein
MTGGRHSAVCRAPDGVVSDWQQTSRSVPAGAVRRYLTAGSTVRAETPPSALARAMIDACADSLIVVDELYRPVGIVSRLDVLAALAHAARPASG